MTADLEKRILQLGNVSVSPKSAGLMSTLEIDLYLARHVMGDYGEVTVAEMQVNDLAMYLRRGKATSLFETEHGLLYVITRFNQPLTVIAYEDEVNNERPLPDTEGPNVQ